MFSLPAECPSQSQDSPGQPSRLNSSAAPSLHSNVLVDPSVEGGEEAVKLEVEDRRFFSDVVCIRT